MGIALKAGLGGPETALRLVPLDEVWIGRIILHGNRKPREATRSLRSAEAARPQAIGERGGMVAQTCPPAAASQGDRFSSLGKPQCRGKPGDHTVQRGFRSGVRECRKAQKRISRFAQNSCDRYSTQPLFTFPFAPGSAREITGSSYMWINLLRLPSCPVATISNIVSPDRKIGQFFGRLTPNRSAPHGGVGAGLRRRCPAPRMQAEFRMLPDRAARRRQAARGVEAAGPKEVDRVYGGRGILQFEANSGSRGDSKKRTHFARWVDLQNEANA